MMSEISKIDKPAHSPFTLGEEHADNGEFDGFSIYDAQGRTIASCPSDKEDVANYIVNCVNSHGALVDALIMALPIVEDGLLEEAYKPEAIQKLINQIKDALKKAGAL